MYLFVIFFIFSQIRSESASPSRPCLREDFVVERKKTLLLDWSSISKFVPAEWPDVRLFSPGVSSRFCEVCVDGARILAIFPTPSSSHTRYCNALTEALAAKGHELTVISVYPLKTDLPNYTNIQMENLLAELMKKFDPFEKQMPTIVGPFILWDVAPGICDQTLDMPEVKKLIQSTDVKFDLLLLELFASECFFGFAHKFNVPVVGISSNAISDFTGDPVGNPIEPAYMPEMTAPYTDHMSFFERVVNTFHSLLMRIGRAYISIPKQEAVMRKHFGHLENLPSISEMELSVALMIYNIDNAFNYPRPMTPNTIQAGGIHIKPPRKLPEDLQKFMDEASEGVIYFCFGGNVKSSAMPEMQRDAIVKVFASLKQRVLWKWETDDLPGKPSNVKTGKWLPQNDILGHKNVLFFITHGGLLGSQEAMYHGVPVLGIPFMADQKANIARARAIGYGIYMDFLNITEESFRWAVSELINNPSYREKAREIAGLYQDQPERPLERAVFWTEYVLRHGGAPHLRSAALDLCWPQYLLLDVIAVACLPLLLLLLTGLLCCRRLRRDRNSITLKKRQ